MHSLFQIKTEEQFEFRAWKKEMVSLHCHICTTDKAKSEIEQKMKIVIAE